MDDVGKIKGPRDIGDIVIYVTLDQRWFASGRWWALLKLFLSTGRFWVVSRRKRRQTFGVAFSSTGTE